jgi:hypothetical protein
MIKILLPVLVIVAKSKSFPLYVLKNHRVMPIYVGLLYCSMDVKMFFLSIAQYRC